MKMHTRHDPRAGFTLIELLTVMAIIIILLGILIPTVGKVRDTARRTADSSNVRQIVQAALIYANDFNGRLPGTGQTPLGPDGEVTRAAGQPGTGSTGNEVSIFQFAGALAQNGGLNDANIWTSAADQAALDNPQLTTVITAERTLEASFKGTEETKPVLSYMAISGLVTTLPSTTPVVFTRGLDTEGHWAPAATTAAGGVYGDAGGHIGFLGGNVQFYTSLAAVQIAGNAGRPTSNILEAIPPATSGTTTQPNALLSGEPGVAQTSN